MTSPKINEYDARIGYPLERLISKMHKYDARSWKRIVNYMTEKPPHKIKLSNHEKCIIESIKRIIHAWDTPIITSQKSTVLASQHGPNSE